MLNKSLKNPNTSLEQAFDQSFLIIEVSTTREDISLRPAAVYRV